MQTLEAVLAHLTTGKPIQRYPIEEKIHPEFPDMKIVDETPCSTTLPNGQRCDGVDQYVKKKTLSESDWYDYSYCIPCEKCNVEKLLHRCFGRLDSRPEQASAISKGIQGRLKVRPERTKYNEAAMMSLKELLVNPKTNRSVILMGPTGTGKTFLAQHTLKTMIKKFRKKCLYVQEHTILHAWRFSQDKTRGETCVWGCNLLAAARMSDYLLIDDFGASRRTSDGALDALEELIMIRYDAAKPVIITTNMSPEDIELRRGQRVWSRLKGMAKEHVVVIKGGDYREKVRFEV